MPFHAKTDRRQDNCGVPYGRPMRNRCQATIFSTPLRHSACRPTGAPSRDGLFRDGFQPAEQHVGVLGRGFRPDGIDVVKGPVSFFRAKRRECDREQNSIPLVLVFSPTFSPYWMLSSNCLISSELRGPTPYVLSSSASIHLTHYLSCKVDFIEPTHFSRSNPLDTPSLHCYPLWKLLQSDAMEDSV